MNGFTRLSGLTVPGPRYFFKVSSTPDFDSKILSTAESGFEAQNLLKFCPEYCSNEPTVRLHVLRNLKTFDDAPNSCVLPDAAALCGIAASVQEIRDRLGRLARSTMPPNDFGKPPCTLRVEDFEARVSSIFKVPQPGKFREQKPLRTKRKISSNSGQNSKVLANFGKELLFVSA